MQQATARHSVIDRLRRYQSLKLAFRVFRECRAAYHLSRNRLSSLMRGQIRGNRKIDYMQSVPQHRMALTAFSTMDELTHKLNEAGIRQDHGSHAVYLRPQPGLRNVLGNVVDNYPPDAGFKILRMFDPPDRASYIRNASVRPATRLMMGPVVHQALAANALHCLGLGPECYGVVHLKAGPEDLMAFVMRHVDGEAPSWDDAQAFLTHLDQAVNEGVLEIVPKSAIEDLDFRLPDCNGNLLRERSTGRLHYVDFQRFVSRPRQLLRKIASGSMQALHFGGTSTLFRGGKRYLYQSIPGLGGSGKRDTLYRWDRFRSVLDAHGVSCAGRVALDVCCNSGMMLTQALKSGATWGIGWDLPGVVERSEKIMSALGATRASLIPAQLGPEYQIAESIPAWLRGHLEGSVVLYLAAVQHVGVIRDLKRVPWKALLFEGHQGEASEVTNSHLKDMVATWNCRIVDQGTLRDGDCGQRAFALLLRD